MTYLPIKFGSRLNRAFKEMESKGIIARKNFACCMTCGYAEIDNEIDKSENPDKWIGVCFYHSQDNDAKKKGYNFHLCYDTTGKTLHTQKMIGLMVCECLNNNGINCNWNRDVKTRIEVIQK